MDEDWKLSTPSWKLQGGMGMAGQQRSLLPVGTPREELLKGGCCNLFKGSRVVPRYQSCLLYQFPSEALREVLFS